MRFRFRYMKADGTSTDVTTLDDLRALVEAGEVDGETLLYDALTREWAPVRAHTVFALLVDELEGVGGAGEDAAVAEGSAGDGHAAVAEEASAVVGDGPPSEERSTGIGDTPAAPEVRDRAGDPPAAQDAPAATERPAGEEAPAGKEPATAEEDLADAAGSPVAERPGVAGADVPVSGEGSAAGAEPPASAEPPAGDEPAVAAPGGGASALDLSDLGLDVSLADTGPEEASSAEEQVREVLEQRAREEGDWEDGPPRVDVGDDRLVLSSEEDGPPLPRPGRAPRDEDPPTERREPAARAGAAAREPDPPPPPRNPVRGPVAAPPREPSRRRRSWAPAALLALGGVGIAALVAQAASDRADDDRTSAPAAPASAVALPPSASASAPRPEPSELAVRMARTESVAFRDMMEGMDSLRRAFDVADVPSSWLEARYLANASRFPDVRDYWERYGSFVRTLQERDTALFRQSFVSRAREQGIDGSMLSMRLARAVKGFEASQPRRDTLYLHMSELAAASMDLHDLLVEREGDITYEPSTAARPSREPVLEAVPEDPVLKDRMWTLLDRIFHALGELHGEQPSTREGLSDRLLEDVRASGGS